MKEVEQLDKYEVFKCDSNYFLHPMTVTLQFMS